MGVSQAISTKVGLTRTLRALVAHAPVDADTFYPACYDLSDENDRGAFLDTYLHLCACSILRKSAAWQPCVPVRWLALGVVEFFLAQRDHADIDVALEASLVALDPIECHALLHFVYDQLGDAIDNCHPLAPLPTPLRQSLSDPKQATSSTNCNGNTGTGAKQQQAVCSSSPPPDTPPPAAPGKQTSVSHDSPTRKRTSGCSWFKRWDHAPAGRGHLYDQEFIDCANEGARVLKGWMAAASSGGQVTLASTFAQTLLDEHGTAAFDERVCQGCVLHNRINRLRNRHCEGLFCCLILIAQ